MRLRETLFIQIISCQSGTSRETANEKVTEKRDLFRSGALLLVD